MADTYACASCGLPVDGPSQVVEGKLYHPRCATAFLRDRRRLEYPYKCPVCRGDKTVVHPTQTERRTRLVPDEYASWGGSPYRTDTQHVPVRVTCPAECTDGRLKIEPVPLRATVGYVVDGRHIKSGDDYKLRFDDIREGS